jgi:chromate transporter
MKSMTPTDAAPEPASGRTSLGALAGYFLRLGLTSFGGPPAHIAMMEEGVVTRRRWVSPAQFAEGLAVCQMLPGPVSTQLGIYVGYLRGGVAGACLAGIGFLLPAYLILVALSALYWRYGSVPAFGSVFYGLNPAVIALILAAAWRLARSGVRGAPAATVATAAGAARAALGVSELHILLAAGVLGALLPALNRAEDSLGSPPPEGEGGDGTGARAPSTGGGLAAVAVPAAGALLLPLAVFFFKVGAFVFGGGYVIVPLMESHVVDRMGWMSRAEFLDGVALGQVTPGPVLITAAFVGYRVAGIAGSAVATAAIFLPSFLWVLALAPRLARLRRWRRMRGFLSAATPAAVGLIAVSAWSLGRACIIDAPTAVIAATALVLALRRGARPALLILGAAAAGLLLKA